MICKINTVLFRERKVTVFGLTEAVGVTKAQFMSLNIGLLFVLPAMKHLIPFHRTLS